MGKLEPRRIQTDSPSSDRLRSRSEGTQTSGVPTEWNYRLLLLPKFLEKTGTLDLIDVAIVKERFRRRIGRAGAVD